MPNRRVYNIFIFDEITACFVTMKFLTQSCLSINRFVIRDLNLFLWNKPWGISWKRSLENEELGTWNFQEANTRKKLWGFESQHVSRRRKGALLTDDTNFPTDVWSSITMVNSCCKIDRISTMIWWQAFRQIKCLQDKLLKLPFYDFTINKLYILETRAFNAAQIIVFVYEFPKLLKKLWLET